MKLDGKHVLVVGLGKSGIAAARFLLGRGIRVSVSEGGRALLPDSEAVRWLQERGVYCELGRHSAELFAGVDAILLSPGVPLDIPALEGARQAGVPIIGELALAAAYLETPVIAVTGTNGKSTVTTLIGEILAGAGKKVFVGGNLGTPLCEYLAGAQTVDWVVLEVSSFQLDSAGQFRPRIGLLLNISPDHLDRYPDYQAYVASKWRLFAHQRQDDWAIVNDQDPEILRWLAASPPASQLYGFGGAGRAGALAQSAEKEIPPARSPLAAGPGDCLRDPEPVAAGQIVVRVAATGAEPESYALSGTALAEEPNRQNALAAVLASRLAGCSPAGVQRGLAAFRALPHRLALVAEIDGVRFYDDSKATNIGAVASALKGMQGPVVLIAGGLDKGGDYRLLLPVVREKVKAMVLIGSAREKMTAAFAATVRVVAAPDLGAAVSLARELAAPGEAVLLSPACASFDMFSGYAQRGEVFRRAVVELARSGGGGGRGAAATGLCPALQAVVA